jgi:hypothetical protein
LRWDKASLCSQARGDCFDAVFFFFGQVFVYCEFSFCFESEAINTRYVRMLATCEVVALSHYLNEIHSVHSFCVLRFYVFIDCSGSEGCSNAFCCVEKFYCVCVCFFGGGWMGWGLLIVVGCLSMDSNVLQSHGTVLFTKSLGLPPPSTTAPADTPTSIQGEKTPAPLLASRHGDRLACARRQENLRDSAQRLVVTEWCRDWCR